MTQTDIPHWTLTFQLKLMAALDAAWATLEASDDPAEMRRARDKAKAIGELAAVARKVALIIPSPRKPLAGAGLSVPRSVGDLSGMASLLTPATAPMAAAAEPARRTLDKLKGGGRGRI